MIYDVFHATPHDREFCLVPESGAAPISASTLLSHIRATAAELAAAGARSGDRLIFCGEQGLDAFVSFWATIAIGAVFVPLDPGWPDYLRRKALEKIRPRLVLLDDRDEQTLWNDLDSPIKSINIALRTNGASHCAAPSFTPAEVSPEAPAACLFTSGTTSEPKVVVLSRQSLLRSATLAVQTFDWTAGERLVNLPEPHTMSGLRNSFLAAPLAKMCWHCAGRSQRPEIFGLLATIDAIQPHRLVAGPLLIRQLNLLGRRVHDRVLATTRAFYCTGTDLNATEAAHFHARFRIPVVNYYGLTESAGLCLSQRVAEWNANDSSIGWPVGCEVRTVNAQGDVVPPGADGELQVRQEMPMSGYLDDAAATQALFVDGWLRTGDIARQHADGRVTIVGRRSTFIKTQNSERVHPLEIEAALEQFEGIAEAAVCGLPQRAGGEVIAALLVARDGRASDADLHGAISRFVTERLGRERTPVAFRWVRMLPRSDNGKLLRSQLQDLFDA